MYAKIVDCDDVHCPDRIFFPFLFDCDACPHRNEHFGMITEIYKDGTGKKEENRID